LQTEYGQKQADQWFAIDDTLFISLENDVMRRLEYRLLAITPLEIAQALQKLIQCPNNENPEFGVY